LFRTARLCGKIAAPAIDGISNQCVSDVGSVNPYLMRATCFKPALDRCGMSAKCFRYGDARDCMTPALENDCLPLSISLVPCKLSCDLDDSTWFETDSLQSVKSRIASRRDPIANSPIQSFDRMIGKLCRKSMVRRVGLCDDQQARSILVDPMHDARSFFPADPGKLTVKVVKECVHQCSARRPWCWVNDHSG
jgi:hypothetical protein